MKAQNSGRYAALMGDLVSSGTAPSFEELHEKFNRAIDRENHAHRDVLASPLTITLGDEFQGLTRTLVGGLEIVRSLRLRLLREGVDCRFALGLVELRTGLNETRAWNMMGYGLAQTREKLNEKRLDTRYRFSLTDNPPLEATLDALGASLTAIEHRWTERQLHDISSLLDGSSPQDLAKLRNVSVHSVYKVRNSGEFDLYTYEWDSITKALNYLDQHKQLA